MDPAIISALSVVGGSLVGTLASVLSTMMSQQSVYRRDLLGKQITDRETLYSSFISEASRTMIDSLNHNLDRMDGLIPLYTLVGRIRLRSSASVVAAAEKVTKDILANYFKPNLSPAQFKEMALTPGIDPLEEFSHICRAELLALAEGYGFAHAGKQSRRQQSIIKGSAK
jgi:hypothetical protein